MTAERLTAMLLELRQHQAISTPVVVPQPYPVLAKQPPYTTTCDGAQC